MASPSPITTPIIERVSPIMSCCPPAGRLEAIVTGPAAGMPQRLISRCVDTGPDGDPNPAMVLADIVPRSAADSTRKISQSSLKLISNTGPRSRRKRRLTIHREFSEDKKGFYITEKIRARCRSNGARKGRNLSALENRQCFTRTTPHAHHQVHFLAYAENDRGRTRDPLWLDNRECSFRRFPSTSSWTSPTP